MRRQALAAAAALATATYRGAGGPPHACRVLVIAQSHLAARLLKHGQRPQGCGQRGIPVVLLPKSTRVGGSRHGTPFDAVNSCNPVALAFFRGQPLPAAETLRIDTPERAPRAAPAAFSN